MLGIAWMVWIARCSAGNQALDVGAGDSHDQSSRNIHELSHCIYNALPPFQCPVRDSVHLSVIKRSRREPYHDCPSRWTLLGRLAPCWIFLGSSAGRAVLSAALAQNSIVRTRGPSKLGRIKRDREVPCPWPLA